jgi:hypothetical protein
VTYRVCDGGGRPPGHKPVPENVEDDDLPTGTGRLWYYVHEPERAASFERFEEERRRKRGEELAGDYKRLKRSRDWAFALGLLTVLANLILLLLVVAGTRR